MQNGDRGTGDRQVFELGEAIHRHPQQKSRLPRNAEYMEKWRQRYLEHMKPVDRYISKYSYREGTMMKTCVICRRTMVLYNFYSFQQGVGDTTARFCRRCRLRHTQEWRELRLKRRESNMHPETLTEANLGMIKPELVDLGYDQSHQNRDHEKNTHPSPAMELAATLRNIPQAPKNEEKVLSWRSSVTSPDSGASAASERLLPPIASIVGDIPSVFRPAAMHGTRGASSRDPTSAPKSMILTVPHPSAPKGAIADTMNVLVDRSLAYYWYARERAQQQIRVGLSRTRGASASLLARLPKNDEIKEMKKNAGFFDRDQPDHGLKPQKWPGYGETHATDSSRGVLSERRPSLVPAASYSMPGNIRPELRKREGHEYPQTTRQDTASAGQTNNSDQGLLAPEVATSSLIPPTGKPGEPFYESEEGVRVPSSCEDVPPGCPAGKEAKRVLEPPAVCPKQRLAALSIEQRDTADGIDMSAIVKITG